MSAWRRRGPAAETGRLSGGGRPSGPSGAAPGASPGPRTPPRRDVATRGGQAAGPFQDASIIGPILTHPDAAPCCPRPRSRRSTCPGSATAAARRPAGGLWALAVLVMAQAPTSASPSSSRARARSRGRLRQLPFRPTILDAQLEPAPLITFLAPGGSALGPATLLPRGRLLVADGLLHRPPYVFDDAGEGRRRKQPRYRRPQHESMAHRPLRYSIQICTRRPRLVDLQDLRRPQLPQPLPEVLGVVALAAELAASRRRAGS